MRGRMLLAVLIGIVGLYLIWIYDSNDATQPPQPSSTASRPSGSSSTSTLPAEAIETIELIRSGGPFPHRKDGTVFMNRERLLPAHEGGYWREYTVPTPGESDRGARRIIHGKGDEYFYTDDHYASFERIRAPEVTNR